jgi:hypothetical protein
MKAFVIFSSREPILVVTRHAIRDEVNLNQLSRIGIQKFIAREVPIPQLRRLYGRQFDVIEEAIRKGNDLRVLDFSGHRIFQNLPFSELGPAYRREHSPAKSGPIQESPRATSRPNPGPVSPAVFR